LLARILFILGKDKVMAIFLNEAQTDLHDGLKQNNNKNYLMQDTLVESVVKEITTYTPVSMPRPHLFNTIPVEQILASETSFDFS
jgi:hypothetical protein